MDIMLGQIKPNSIERELERVLNGPERETKSSALRHKENSSQGNGIRDIGDGNSFSGRDGLLVSIEILSDKMNTRLSQEMDLLMNMTHTQINRAIISAISDRVFSEIQIKFWNLALNQKGTGTGTSTYDQGIES